MLQILRNKAQSPFIQAVVVIIALVFIFWGVGTNMMNNREAALVVNGEEITFQQYQQAYDQAYQRLADQVGGNVPKGLAESLNLKQQVINQLIQTALLRQGAHDMGIIVSKEEIQRTINEMVQFQDAGGFSMEKYQSLLSANRLSPTKFESNLRFDLLAGKAQQDITNFALLSSDYEVEELYRQSNEQVAVSYVKVAPEDFTAKITVDDAELAVWFETTKDNYRGEPELKLQYLSFTYDEIGSRITIDDEQISSYYDENIAQFRSPETRRARHILIKSEEGSPEEQQAELRKKAEELLQLARTGSDFGSLAGQYSEDQSKDNGGDLGFMPQGVTVPPFDEAVFSMQPGDISEVIQTRFGFHIIKLEEIKPAATKVLAEIRGEIIQTLRNKEAQPLAFQLASSAYEGIIGAGSLKAYAESASEQVIHTTDFFPRSVPPADLAEDNEFLTKAFSLNAGELSSIVKTAKGHYIIFAETVQEPETPTLDEVRDTAEADYLDATASEAAQKTAAEILDRLKGGEPFDDLAGEAGMTLLDSGLLSRNSPTTGTDFPASLATQVFQLTASDPFPESAALEEGGYYVFAFAKRQLPEITSEVDLQPYRDSLLNAKRQELLSAYISSMEKEAEITRHQSL